MSRKLRQQERFEKSAMLPDTVRQSLGFEAFTYVLRHLCRKGIEVSLLPNL